MTSERTLQSVVDSLREHGKKTALVVFGKKDRYHWSFQELAACALSFVNGLVKHDFKRGDTIAIFSENSPESIAAVLGIIRAGMIAVPLDVQLEGAAEGDVEDLKTFANRQNRQPARERVLGSLKLPPVTLRLDLFI